MAPSDNPALIMTVSHANARIFSIQGFDVTRTATVLVKVDSNPDSRLRYPPLGRSGRIRDFR